jgi:hypothetical protein
MERCLVVAAVMLSSVALMAQLQLEVESGAQKSISHPSFKSCRIKH